jgi:SAM-dependent methyltransferase
MSETGRDPLADVVRAYEGLEDPSAFPDDAALERYREGLLERSAEQVAFLLQRLDAPARVLEAACGNGRLLVALAQRGALDEGVGFDVAASRIAFARAWADDLGLDELTLTAEDARTIELAEGHYDAAVCITGSLAYFEPAQPGLAAEVLRRLRAALRAGGLLVLELYPHPRERALVEAAGGELRSWRELPADDPWRYYLSHLRFDAGTGVLDHAKTFVHRTTGEIDDGRRERILLYTPQSLAAAVAAAGFEDTQLYEGWTAEPYAGGDILVAVARPSPR